VPLGGLNQMNQSKAFMISLICAAGAMLLVHFYISEQEGKIKKEFGDEVRVIVASRDIAEFEVIREDMLTITTMPKKFVQEGSLTDKEAFKKTPAVAAAPFRRGQQVLVHQVLFRGAETGLASQVAITRRAISIPVTDVTGVTKLLKQGDRVDVVANISYPGPSGQLSEVKTLLQDINILAVGEVIQNQIPSVFEEDPISGNRRAVNLRGNRAFSTVTVEVTPQQAQVLVYTIETGATLFLTLRNPIDRVTPAIPTTTVDQVLGPDSKKAILERPVAPPPVIRAPAAVRPPPPPPPNPWSQGGGSLVQ